MFSYRIATIDGGFTFINDIESLDLNFIVGCFLVGVGFLGHGGLGVWFLSLNQLSQAAEPKDYIYSIACEV